MAKLSNAQRAVPAASNYRVGLIAPIDLRRNQSDVKAANLMVCRSAFSRLPTVESVGFERGTA